MVKKTVLIAPLNWGLGHATRSIPLIRSLLENNFNVIIAGEGASGELLKREFPELQYIYLPSFSVIYPKSRLFILKLFIQVPKIIRGIRREHKELQKIIRQYTIDIILSDNRYGLYSAQIPSVFMTHQISPALPGILKIVEKVLFKVHLKRINKFDACLIPDFEGENNLSGKLSHTYKLSEKFKFIGIISRFEKQTTEANFAEKYDITVILSGPEPQRTIFEKKLTEQLKSAEKQVLIIQGKPGEDLDILKGNIRYISHISAGQMQNVILNSETIICRSGYSSIMDLVALKKKAILVPTPGQTEQEYLARYLSDKSLFVTQKQKDLNLSEALKELETINPEFEKFSGFKSSDFIKIFLNI